MNNPDAHEGLLAIARAISSGLPVDWGSADSNVSDATMRAIVRELKVVADIAELHGTLGPPDADVSVWDSIAKSGGAAEEPTATTVEEARLPAWGPLLLVERVGRGAFGEIYRAWDRRLQRQVALKLLRPRVGDERDSVGTSVIEEGRLLARVRHANVVSVYGADRIDGRVGVWMEFVRGRTLERVLRDQGPFSSHEATVVGRDLCRALSAVHHAGLLHRDVKTQNVMREDGGRIVLMDFGTGRESDEGDRMTGSDFAGTPLYMAPEVLALKPAAVASDLYSLGVLLFHLVTGSYPVKGRSVEEIREAHAGGSRTYLRDLRPEIDPAFAEVVERALASDAARRFDTAGHMERALGAALARQADAGGATEIEPVPSVPLSVPPSWFRARYVMAAAGAVAVGLAAIAIGPLRTFRSPNQPSGPPAGAAAAAIVQTQQNRRIPAPEALYFIGRPSPDGRAHTFVNIDGDLAVFDTMTGSQRRLMNKGKTNEFVDWSSAFSADGKQIAYTWWALDGAIELRMIGADGNWPRVVLRRTDEVPEPLQWSHDGARILVIFQDKDDGTRRLALVSAADGAVTPITGVDARHSTASLSPDGRYVAFDKQQQEGAFERDIYLAPIDPPGAPVPFITGIRDDFAPLWTADGKQVVFVSDRGGEPSLWSVPVVDGVTTGEPEMVYRNVGAIQPSGLTSDGTLFYELRVGLVDVYAATIDFALEKVIDRPRSVAPSHIGSNTSSSWSPDGRSLAFVTLPHGGSATGPRRITILDVASGATRTLSPALGSYGNVRWSPDGRTLLVKGEDLKSRPGLYLVDPDTGQARAAALVDRRTPKQIQAMGWGADGRTLLYTREGIGLIALNLDTQVETTLFDFASDGITGFSNGVAFRLSPDGRVLAYTAYRKKSDGTSETMLRIKPLGGVARDLVADGRIQAWTRDGQQLVFSKYVKGTQRQTLWMVSAAGGTPRSLGLDMIGLNDLTVHPDGRRVTFTAGMPGGEVWALHNFLPARQ